MTDARLAYAAARVHARHSRRPGAPQWGALGASRTPQHYVAALRASGWLRVPELDVAADPDRRESWLRDLWRESCEEVASWYPPHWRNAVRSLSTLPELDVPERTSVDETRRDAWLRVWRAALPNDAASRRHLRLLESTVRRASSLSSDARREMLERAATRTLNRAGTGAAVGFAYLLLLALRLERVRGDLASRAIASWGAR
jgi:hypothetical protein